jgi:lysophospholipase L1-like esterase
MRTVLCFGDSNTWGYDPVTGGRFSREERWPGRLQAALGDGWYVIEEGLNGRTATLDSPVAPGRNGLAYLVPCLDSHAPLDAVVIFLGTNDMSDRYSLSATDVATAAGRLVGVVRASAAGVDGVPPLPLLVCPPPVGDAEWLEGWQGVPAKSAVLAERFRVEAEERGCELLDLGAVTRYSDLDGIHLEADAHAAVARAVEERLRALLP